MKERHEHRRLSPHVQVVKKAVALATFRDKSSGGVIRLAVIDKDGTHRQVRRESPRSRHSNWRSLIALPLVEEGTFTRSYSSFSCSAPILRVLFRRLKRSWHISPSRSTSFNRGTDNSRLQLRNSSLLLFFSFSNKLTILQNLVSLICGFFPCCYLIRLLPLSLLSLVLESTL